MYELFIEPLTYGFMQRGLLVTVLAALVCALLSCWLVLMGWSLMGDGISHAVLPGVALAYILGAPFALGALLAALVAVALIGSVAARRRVREDAAIGIVFTVMFALGLVLLSAFPSQVDLHSVIFGNVLGVSWADVWQIGLLAVLVVAVLLVKRRDLVLYAFDPGYTHAIGLSPRLLSSLLLVALALTSVLALQIVGVVLVVALLVIPGATARLLTDRFTSMLLISSAVSLLAALAGFFLAYLLDISAGGTVVLALGVLFGLAYLFAPRHGLLAAARARRAVEAGQG
ncbi:metal ABC transporter permease [Rothia nasimurium]|uniref:metal ABC transporter permease n=1 Tax=Rothia nasimurium TaxID=85336 RepID=UPI001F1E453A|nr:metal ABC transporter permease [Rothia nasimurium]